jgi:cytochrome c5
MSQTPDNASHDKHFFDTFMLVLGILFGVTIALIFAARAIAARTQNVQVLEDPSVKQATAERIAPVAKLAVSGADNSAFDPPKAQIQVAAVDLSGQEVFNAACMACHGPGIAGAPKYGDKTLWAPRIAQGMPTLYKHALEGFTGKAGVMFAKGGRADYSDKSITNAVDYMVAGSK